MKRQQTKSLDRIVKDTEEPVEILASQISSISEGMRSLRSGRLRDGALYLLIQNAIPGRVASRPSIETITSVVEAMTELDTKYLKGGR